MQRALDLARQAQDHDEVPVGAVLVLDNEIIGEGFNSPISSADVSAHAEIQALRQASAHQDNYRLPKSTLYVTLEPCPMCAGAIVHARISRVVIAAAEPRAGAGGSVFNILNDERLNHRCEVEFGLLEEPSRVLIQGFFRARRDLSCRGFNQFWARFERGMAFGSHNAAR